MTFWGEVVRFFFVFRFFVFSLLAAIILSLDSHLLPCAVKINAPWRNFINPIFMRDMKIILGVKATYIDVHRPPTSWVCTVHGHRDIGSWPKFRGSHKPVISVVHPISRYLNFEIFDFLYENDFDANADDARQSWGNFQFFHEKKFEMHMGGTLYDEQYSILWVFPQRFFIICAYILCSKGWNLIQILAED